MTALQIAGLCVRLPGRPKPVLAGLDLEVMPGEIVGIVGESGVGKTMLLRAICRALPPGARLEGRIDLQGSAVATVMQAPMAGLSPLRRAGAQVADVASPGTVQPDVFLEQVGLPARVARLFPQELSGGMQMRVALARAMATGARLILADEPTAALDGPTARIVLDSLSRLRAAGRAVLIVTHDPALVASVCDRIGVLHDGRVIECRPAAELLARPEHPTSRALMAALPSRATRLADGWVGSDRGPVLEMRAASRRHPNGQGAFEIDLGLSAGEVLAVCGPSGCGKTTLARMAARLTPLTAGSIRLDGAEIGNIHPSRFSGDPRRATVQMVFQDPAASFPPWYAVRQAFAGAGQEEVEAACLGAGLDAALLDRVPGQLSQGQLARAALARATVRRPRVLILDEPTAALDATVQAGVLRHIDQLRRLGMAVLLVTHDLHVARIVAHRIAVMDEGRLVEVGPAAQMLAAPVHPTTRAMVATMS